MPKVGGLELKNPFVVASGPTTRSIDLLKEADRAGAAAASIKLTLLQQPFPAKMRIYTEPPLGAITSQDKRLELAEAQALIRQAKRQTGLLLMANITHRADDYDGWIKLARALEEAGADMIEANFTCGNIGLTSKLAGAPAPVPAGAMIGQNPQLARELTAVLKESLSIPVVCKLTARVADISETAAACAQGGADAVTVGGGVSALPPVDIYHPDRSPYGLANGVTFGAQIGRAIRYQSYANVARTYRTVDIPVIGVGGLETWEDAVQFMMWGASLVSACTAIMWHGFDVIGKVLQGMERFMTEAGYSSYEELVGRAQPLIKSAYDLVFIPGAAVVDPERCSGCGLCLKPGHCHAISLVDERAVVNPEHCVGCAICARLCPRQAIRMVAHEAQA